MSISQNKIEKKQQQERDKLNDKRDERCVPVALSVLQELGRFEKHSFVEKDSSVVFNNYGELSRFILRKALDEDIRAGEINYVFQLALKSLNDLQSIVVESVNKHLRTIQEQEFGGPLNEITMKSLHARLGGDIIDKTE